MDVQGGNQATAGLLGQCRVYIVKGSSLTDVVASKLASTVEDNGGFVVTSSTKAGLPLEDVTHVISSNSDFPDYDKACDALIPVVKPDWIEASITRGKLANPRQYSPDPRLFMSDVVICCADLPDGDKDAIIGGVLAMGGLYSPKVATMVTHIVALTMDSEKCAIVRNKKLDIKIVLPHWFDDCLKLGRRIDERPYMLPDPEILRGTSDMAPKSLGSKDVIGATTAEPANLPTPNSSPASSEREVDVFMNKKVMLSENLGIGSHLRGIIEDIVSKGGGSITTSVYKADMYISKYRDGEDYKVASRAGKEVGNLAWLYYLITYNTWTSPLQRLLHYPIARNGLPDFKDFRISLSNYSGDARIYLENLIIAAGAECTKTLKQDNTHLITAHDTSEKCAAAKDWNIHMVNHLWLEESYARWRVQSVANPRYTHFPQRTNLGEVVGQTKIDRHAVQYHFYSEEDTDTEEAAEKVQPMKQKDQNALVTGVANGSRQSPKKAPVKSKPKTRIAQEGVQTPSHHRVIASGKENHTPGTGSSRKAKCVAAAKLHDIAPDIALFEKESKRVGGVIHGGRRKNDPDRVGSKKHTAAVDEDDTDTERDAKRQKTSNGAAISQHLLISGYKRWVGQPAVEDKDKKRLRQLGIMVTQDPSRATHMAAPTILRTHKFIAALAHAPAILSIKYVDDSLTSDELLDPQKYLLKDTVNEKKFGFTLKQSSERAKKNRNQLLAGRSIYCVEDIHGGFDIMKSIAEVNGGTCQTYRGRPTSLIPSHRADTDADPGDDEAILISGTSKDDQRLWPRFQQMAEGARKVPRIVRADWLLETAMSQEILPLSNYELDEGE